MAVNPQKRRKKIEKRTAKQKAERREMARRSQSGLPARLRQAASAPILHCCAGKTLWNQGLGQVLISRQLPGGQVAFAVFLVDRFCLGAKDAFANVAPRPTYTRSLYEKLAASDTLVPLDPPDARKLVEGAVQYALDLGIPPHPDYSVAKLILGDIDVAGATEDFEFGKNGKPFFIAGPHDHAARCQQILRTLEQRCGPDGFDFLMPAEVFPIGRLPMANGSNRVSRADR
jgi:hypothetical protein